MYSEQAIDDRGSGTPLVLLHSSMSSRAQWRRLSEQLGNRYRIIAIDLYGYGDSEFPGSPERFSLAREAERILRIINDRAGDQQFHLIGHSYGGATALRLAHERPSRVLSLGLYEPVAFHLLEPGDQVYRLMQRVRVQLEKLLAAGSTSAATAHFIDFWSGPGSYDRLPSGRQRSLDRYIPKVALDFKALFEESIKPEQCRNLSMPVCLLRSHESPLPTRRVAQLLEQNLPRLQARWVDGGHMAPVVNADVVNGYWIEFLDNLPG